METKTYIWIGLTLGGVVGGIVGAALDHGNPFGVWGIVLSAAGSLVGIWVGYKLGNS